MKMDKIASSNNDEYYTPLYAIKPIEKYLKRNSNIWCPFDTEDSLFVKYLTKQGHNVTFSHIGEDTDFFYIPYKTFKNRSIDYIISNPPYSMKTEVLERLFELEIPFAMLLGVVGLFESQRRFEMFKYNEFEIMYLNRRVSYLRAYEDDKPAINPPFSSVYITHNILPKYIVFEEVDKKDVKM